MPTHAPAASTNGGKTVDFMTATLEKCMRAKGWTLKQNPFKTRRHRRTIALQ